MTELCENTHGIFKRPRVAVVAMIATVAGAVLVIHPSPEMSKLSFLFLSATGSGFLTASALGMRAGAKNLSVLLFGLATTLIVMALLFTDDSILALTDPREGLISAFSGATITFIMAALNQHDQESES